MPFKVCPDCKYVWKTREEFLSDPNLKIIGYQVDYNEPQGGLILFTHEIQGCETTLAVRVKSFADFYNGPVCEDLLENTEECPGHCSNIDSLDPCFEKCKCSFARNILQSLRNWPKREKTGDATLNELRP